MCGGGGFWTRTNSLASKMESRWIKHISIRQSQLWVQPLDYLRRDNSIISSFHQHAASAAARCTVFVPDISCGSSIMWSGYNKPLRANCIPYASLILNNQTKLWPVTYRRLKSCSGNIYLCTGGNNSRIPPRSSGSILGTRFRVERHRSSL